MEKTIISLIDNSIYDKQEDINLISNISSKLNINEAQTNLIIYFNHFTYSILSK